MHDETSISTPGTRMGHVGVGQSHAFVGAAPLVGRTAHSLEVCLDSRGPFIDALIVVASSEPVP